MVYIEIIIEIFIIIGIIALAVAISAIICKIQSKRYDKTIALQKEKYSDLYKLYDEWHKYSNLTCECYGTKSRLEQLIDGILNNSKYYNEKDYWTSEKITKLADARTQYKENKDKIKEYGKKRDQLKMKFEELKEKYNVKYL